MNIENIFFNKVLPGSIGFGMELLYSNENMNWNKKLMKKQQMLNEKLVEASSIENVMIKNNRILAAEQERQKELIFLVQEMDKIIEKLKLEKGEENPQIKEWLELRSHLEIA